MKFTLIFVGRLNYPKSLKNKKNAQYCFGYDEQQLNGKGTSNKTWSTALHLVDSFFKMVRVHVDYVYKFCQNHKGYC